MSKNIIALSAKEGVEKMNVKYQVLAVVAGLLFNHASAVEFPGHGGDLASEEAWGGEIPYGEDVSFVNNGRYTLSRELSFGAMGILAPETAFDLSAEGAVVNCTSFSLESKGLGVTISGGRLVSSGDFHAGSTNSTVDAKNNTLVLANGANVTAVNTYVSNKKTGNTLRIAERSSLNLTGDIFMGWNANGNNALEVLSGGMLSVRNFYDGWFSAAKHKTTSSTGNRVLVDGLNSKMTIQKALSVGAVYCDNVFEVSNGAVIENNDRITVGGTATATNSMIVASHGASVSGVELVIGEDSTNSVFRLDDGATATFTKDVYLGGRNGSGNDSRLEIENSSFSCRELKIGGTSSIASKLRMFGAQSQFAVTKKNIGYYPIFMYGSGHEFILDGAQWHHSDKNLRFDTAAENSSIKLLNGAVFTTDGGLYFGTNLTSSCGNTLYVGEGASFSGQFIRIYRENNSLVVSNGCVSLVSTSDSVQNSGLRVGDSYDVPEGMKVGGNRLVLQGSAPKVRSAKAVRVENTSTLRFEIPSAGLDSANTPIVCANFVVDASSSLLAANVFEHSRQIKSAVKYALVETSGENKVSIPQTVIDAANLDLDAQGCRKAYFSISEDKRIVYLTVKSASSGLKVVIK